MFSHVYRRASHGHWPYAYGAFSEVSPVKVLPLNLPKEASRKRLTNQHSATRNLQ
jgi:hypothetical protein